MSWCCCYSWNALFLSQVLLCELCDFDGCLLLFLALIIMRRITGIRIISDISAVLICYYSVFKIKKKDNKVETVKQAKPLPQDRGEGPTGSKLKVRTVQPLHRLCVHYFLFLLTSNLNSRSRCLFFQRS